MNLSRQNLIAMLLGALFLLLPGCADAADEDKAAVEQTATETTAETAKEPEKESPKASESPEKETKPMAVITMENGGVIEIEFYPDVAPKTVESFTTLANKGFYNGLTFHRRVEGFVVQGGDPEGNGRGGPGYTIKAEFSDRPHVRGTVAMARSQDPDSAGSQFYICLAPAPTLNGQYTVFGQVVKGMEVVDKIQVGDRMKSVEIKG